MFRSNTVLYSDFARGFVGGEELAQVDDVLAGVLTVLTVWLSVAGCCPVNGKSLGANLAEDFSPPCAWPS